MLLKITFARSLIKTSHLKTNIDHLPPEKQAELQAIVQSISRRLPAEMIILFGSYARGNWVEDRYQENGTTFEYISDYDVLVVLDTEKQAIHKESEKRWEKRVRRDVGKETPLSAIFHGIDYLNSQIEEGNYFFVDVIKEGIMLFDSGNFKLSVPKLLNVRERKQKAQLYFENWFESAKMFYKDFLYNYNECEKGIHYL